MYNYCKCLTEDRLREHRVQLYASSNQQVGNCSVHESLFCPTIFSPKPFLLSIVPEKFDDTYLVEAARVLMLLTVRFITPIVEMRVFVFDASIGQMVRRIQKTCCQLQIRTGSSVWAGILTKTHWCQRLISCCLLAKPKLMDRKDWRIELPTSIRRPGVPTRSSAPASRCDDLA